MIRNDDALLTPAAAPNNQLTQTHRIPLMEMDSIHVPMIKEALATANCLS